MPTPTHRTAAALIVSIVAAAAGASSTPPPGRAVFEAAWPAALGGRWTLSDEDAERLRGYPLAPDLRAAWYSARLADTKPRELERFMREHSTLAPIRRLRYRYAVHLARQSDWARFRKLYDAHYADAGIAELDCLALRERLANAPGAAGTLTLAQRLWRVPSSQHRQCDAPFEQLLASGAIGDDAIQQRLALAIDARNWSLAAYLADLLGPAQREAVARWRSVARNPAEVLADRRRPVSAAQTDYGLRRLALSDPLRAIELHAALEPGRRLTDEDAAALSRHIAIATAQDYHDEARALLKSLPDSAADARALAWRARAAMRADDWHDVIRAIALMPAEAQASERWRYWEAVALIETGQVDAGRGLLRPLAETRSYHGFLAADRLGLPYRIDSAPLTVDEARIDALRARGDVQRVIELHAVGQPARAENEWGLVLRRLDASDRLAAVALAHRRGWHASAIRQLAAIEAWDHLDVRYPLTAVEPIVEAAATAGIEPTWALAVARSESLFNPYARSGAGAIGIMQLMPQTARRVARQHAIDWPGARALVEPALNATLGSHYLASLAAQWRHPALATAAYNAGPHRIPRWLPAERPLSADAWIETIAYDETRRYVQRVMAAEVVYRHRLGLDTVRLVERLPPVEPDAHTQVATRL